MRLLITALFCSLMSLTFAQDKPIVLGTASMISDMATNIFGDKVDVQTIVPLGGDPHLFEPTPKAAQQVNKANLILVNGLTFEGWLTELIENSGTKAKTIRVTENVKEITSLVYTNAADPHAWMDMTNAIVYSENILKAAKELVPGEAEYFEANFQAYKTELETAHEYIVEQIQKIPAKQRVLVTSHDAFQYYGRKYGLQLESTLGTSTDADVQTSDVIDLQKVIKETGVPAIFVESTVNPKLIKQLAADNGISIGGELYADSLGEEGTGAETYIKMMKQNTDVIVSALSKEKEVVVSEKEEGGGIDAMTYGIVGLILLLLVLFFALRKKA